MSIEVYWLVQSRVIVVTGGGSITADDTSKLDEWVSTFLNQNVESPIHLLLDGVLVERMPGLMVLKKWGWPKHIALGYVMIYGLRDTPLRMVVEVIGRLFGLKFGFVNTFDKAVKTLQKLDKSLPGDIKTKIPEGTDIFPTRPLRKTRISRTVSEQLLKVFNGRCEYCHTTQDAVVKLKVVEIVPDGSIAFENLCFACDTCRQHKQEAQTSADVLFHPRRDYWYEHFQWSPDGMEVVPITPKAQLTIAQLGLNSPEQLARRSQGLREGWHAPDLVRTNHFRDDFFPEGGKVRLEIRDAITSQKVKMIIQPTNVIIFGRSDPGDSLQPDINLGPYGGYRLGVSHIHARINPPVSNALTINDMGSTNGTFVNDDPVKLNEARRLCDADEIRLGNMVMRVYFED